MTDHFIIIDEEGYFVLSQGIRLTDRDVGRQLFKHLVLTETHSLKTKFDQQDVYVEAFDKPIVVEQIERQAGMVWKLIAPYGFETTFNLQSLCLDEWDRFHGLTQEKIPFVFSRKAQAEFFNLLEEFSDDSITVDGHTLVIPPFYIEEPSFVSSNTWTDIYKNSPQPNWDLQGAHPALNAILPQIKIVKSRIANWGCGRGHDAALLAQNGHVVTGFDYSEEAIAQAQKLYSRIPTLTLKVEDALTSKNDAQFDIIFEHTLFCALLPSQRKQLVQKWHKSLDVGGHLLGIFFVMPKRGGPPYGCSEWELRQMLEKKFRLLYWKRWQKSPAHRQGNELVIYAQKI